MNKSAINIWMTCGSSFLYDRSIFFNLADYFGEDTREMS